MPEGPPVPARQPWPPKAPATSSAEHFIAGAFGDSRAHGVKAHPGTVRTESRTGTLKVIASSPYQKQLEIKGNPARLTASQTSSYPLSSLPQPQLSALLKTAKAELQRRISENRLRPYAYAKQRDFHAAGRVRERLCHGRQPVGEDGRRRLRGGDPRDGTLSRLVARAVSSSEANGRVGMAGITRARRRATRCKHILLSRTGSHGTGIDHKGCHRGYQSARDSLPGLVDSIAVSTLRAAIASSSLSL